MTARNAHVFADLTLEVGANPLKVVHLAVVREIRGLRLQRQDASDRIDELIGIELRRCGRRQRKRPAIDVELAVRKTKVSPVNTPRE